jgi:hypothetical protein
MTTPEQEKPVKIPSEIQEIPTTPEIPPEIERGAGVSKPQDDFTAQVSDDSGKPLIQTPQTQTVTVQIPATQTQLDTWAKGPIENAITWFAVFWIRIIKKALHFGWRMISGRRTKENGT